MNHLRPLFRFPQFLYILSNNPLRLMDWMSRGEHLTCATLDILSHNVVHILKNTMTTHALFFGWNRSIPGREKLSAAHSQEFIQYLSGLQQTGAIDSFDLVFLELHGGDLNGFFLLRAAPAKRDALTATSEWNTHMVRAGMHLEGSGAVRAITGEAANERMTLWTSQIPE